MTTAQRTMAINFLSVLVASTRQQAQTGKDEGTFTEKAIREQIDLADALDEVIEALKIGTGHFAYKGSK